MGLGHDRLRKYLNGRDVVRTLTDPRIDDRLEVLYVGGSYAYGLDNDRSDIDLRGMALLPYRDVVLMRDFGQVTDKENDVCVYSCLKFIDLLSKSNPSMLEVFDIPDDCLIYESGNGRAFDMILDSKDLFLSKECYRTFSGYASQQLRKASRKSRRKGKLKKLLRHHVRLTLMGTKVLSGEGVHTRLSDADRELVLSVNGMVSEVGDGIWSPTDDFMTLSDELDNGLRKARDSSPLRRHPDHKGIEELAVRIFEDVIVPSSQHPRPIVDTTDYIISHV